MRLATTITVERGDEEIDVEVTADYTPGHRGRRSGDPGDWEPDEPAEIEILMARRRDTREPLELNEDEDDRARDAIAEELAP